MIKLLAFLPLDGSAIIERESALFFICPPYKKQNLKSIEKKVLDKAILRHDFCAADQFFETWEALISFLDNKVSEVRLQQGQNLAEINLGREIIDCAPPEILDRYLDKIEHELIPLQRFEHADAVIKAMLESDSPSKKIRRRARSLLMLIKSQELVLVFSKSLRISEKKLKANELKRKIVD